MGFPIDINLSFLLLLGVVFFWTGGLTGVVGILIVFASVLVHELGHALLARRLGVRIAGIELYFFGGAAKMIDPPRSAGDEIAITAAGPAVSFALGGLAHLLAAVTGWEFFALIGWINLVLGAFNLIPALPMDGGRILRALLARRLGFASATRRAIQVSRAFAVLFAIAGAATGQFQLIVLAVLIWLMGNNELLAARRRGYRDTPEVEVLPRDWQTFGDYPSRVRIFVRRL